MKIGGFLSNDSMFGKVMTKFGTMIVLNILFVISCLPFITIGPALSALYYSIIEMLRKEEEDMVLGTGGEINPVTVYFKGFRRDFFKCMLYWILFVGIMIMGTINIQISGSWKGIMGNLTYVIISVMLIVYVIFIFGFPLHSQYKGSFKRIVSMALQTAFISPGRSLAVLLLYTVPLVLIRYDEVNKPLYAFIFCFFGCSLIAEMAVKLIRPAMTSVLAAGRAERTVEKTEGT